MSRWVRNSILNATKQYSEPTGKFPRAYDPGDNMGNATYSEMLDYITTRRKELSEEVDKFLSYKQQEGDVWDERAQISQKVLDALPKFGYDTIDYNHKYYYLYNDKEQLGKMFYRKFGRMRMAYNTPTEFNYQLQAIFDDVAEKYNNQLGILALYHKQFYDDSGEIQGKIKDDIELNALSKTDMFTYPHENENKKHITTNEGRVIGIRDKISNLTSMYAPATNIIKNYLDEFYPLFDTVEYATGGYVIQ